MNEEFIRAEIESADKALNEAFIRRLRAISALKEAKRVDDTEISADLAADAALVRRLIEEAPDDVSIDAVARFCRAFIGECVVYQGVKAVRYAGGDATRLVAAARGFFGYAANLTSAVDPREALEAVAEETGVVACLPWPELAGGGQWWPMMNESRFSGLKILSGWPNLPGENAQPLETAIVARKELSPSGADDMYAIAHDDIHDAHRILRNLDMPGEVVARVRSLALIKLSGYITEDDSRLAEARQAGLDGLQIIGVLPRP
ncbi:hypothetical protein [Hirschia baltica]|uniref:Chorismate mutase n=1 Tax=Hirschia baltica (strain ATCC 49814 / DSM 5838 / IFAM 1418) TaxID=582402 RepID=C6XLM2_HIRBI|nr:hypothetical protein [Hirschia baltica]ACT57928.1 hypothetical protein Hbal_0226 [Hirschia baltica ATCC 49814]